MEYTLHGDQLSVDWVSGRDASSMLKAILDIDGGGVSKIWGYVTDKLGKATNDVLQRFGDQVARHLDGDWKATVEQIDERRFLVFTKRGS